MRSAAVLSKFILLASITAAAPSQRARSILPASWNPWSSAADASSFTVESFADPPRISLPPASASEGGWLTKWLNVGGEGTVIVHIGGDNVTIPHRPAAFPSQLLPPLLLPLKGTLYPFQHFLDASTASISTSPELACLPSHFPRFIVPEPPYSIALVERGDCDFASKVRSAQERGAAVVVVGDGKLRDNESDEEGMKRENLITMFSPEDTDSIYIPSVFVSRASYLFLRELLANDTKDAGLWIEIGEGEDEGSALSSLLSFALLMPSLFLLSSIAIHRLRVARQRDAERAPPLLVLSLPERIWSPDIVWEKDSDSESIKSPTTPKKPKPQSPSPSGSPLPDISPPPPISPSEVATPPLEPVEDLSGPSHAKKKRSKSGMSAKKYFSKDECAICMDAFQSGEVVRILPCGHVFHKDECDEWLLKWRKLCPTCRADVTLPPGDVGSGTRMTPVAMTDAEAHDVQHRSIWDRARTGASDAWTRITGRSAIRLEPGERTPLVDRSPTGSPVRTASAEV